MSVSLSKIVNVDGHIFSLAEFIQYVNLNGLGKYKETLESIFRASTLVEKEHESITQYCTRLFYLLYYKKGFGQHDIQDNSISTSTLSNTNCNEYTILETLGINMVKYCNKVSKIIFKNSGNQYRMKNDNIKLLIESIKKRNTFEFNKHDVKFGIELEFIGENSSDSLKIFSKHMTELVGDRYSENLTYNHNDGKMWVLGRDGSLRGDGYGFELTSPIFTYGDKKDLEELQLVIEFVKSDLHGVCNRSCGTHIHMSFDLNQNLTNDIKKYFALSYSMNEETLFDKLVPSYRRDSKNQYCRATDPERLNDRYRKLNLTLTKLNQPTKNMHIEFRQLDGNLDFNKIVTWMKLQKLFIETTIESLEQNTAQINNVKILPLEDVICSNVYDLTEIEKLLTMSKMAS